MSLGIVASWSLLLIDVYELVGREVVFRVFDDFRGCNTKVLNVDGLLNPVQRAELLSFKLARPSAITPFKRLVAAAAHFSSWGMNFRSMQRIPGFRDRPLPHMSTERRAQKGRLW